jgi:hypothetical protein
MRAMSQPVLLKVYGGFMPASPRLHEALRQIAATALPAENVCVALDGDMASLSFEGIYFPLEETLEAIRADGVQIVILDSPEIYSEYAPYTYVEDMKEFIDRVSQLNRAA